MTVDVATNAARARPAPRPAPGPAGRGPDLLAVICIARALVVAGLWVIGGQPELLLAGPADALDSLGRLAGLVAADLLLVQVLLMARIPAIERAYGRDVLARRHRVVGLWSVGLLVLHLVLVTVGYSLGDGSNLLAEAWTLVTTYDGMLLATAGTALLLLVAATSVRAARRRLRYESWHLLHLYAYLGVGLSVPHEIWTGADFASSGVARVYWWGSYALAAGAIVGYRVALPLWRSARHSVTVAGVVAEAPGVVSVHLTGRHLDRLQAKAGQYFVWRFRSGPGWTRGHPYSLSAAPAADRLRVTVKDLGDGSAAAAALPPGTRVLLEGPYGRLTADARTRRKVALLGCGVGVTPLRALLEELPYGRGDATLIQRAHGAGDLLFAAELEELAGRRGATVIPVVGPRVPGRPSWLPASAAAWGEAAALRHLVPDIAERDVYICGPGGWMAAARAAALAAGVPAEAIHEERFGW